MSDYKVPLDDIRFNMKDVFEVDQLWKTLEGIAEIDIETADAILDEGVKLGEQVLAPLNREADEHGCRWDEGEVIAPPGFKEAYQTFSEGGWNGLSGEPAYDGMGMPKTLSCAVEEMIQGSNISFGLCPMLAAGAALAINAHASEELKQRYLPKMYSGEWAGAMDLTEPHCGSDLGLIRTKAIPQADGSYALTGTKIFITWGEHSMADNIIHLVLAKLPDAPAGSRGISLFLVPKFLPTESGLESARNNVTCGSIEKKMGIKASATCVMNFDGAKGWLVGDINKGLACMFTMMNYERLGVGIQGVGVAEASYQTALAYAKERIQGRSADGAKQPEKAADNLLVHPDVRRMLMTMKAFNEGSRAFYIYLAQWLDLAKYSPDEQIRAYADHMGALLTPVAKAFMTDMALQTAIHGQQVLGGHGYVREWGQEQHIRDIRITQIYEGTNGIQAMDLMARKTVSTKGEMLHLFIKDVKEFVNNAKEVAGSEYFLTELMSRVDDLVEVTDEVITQSAQDPFAPGSAAVEYLELFGYVAYGYMWARMAVAALKKGDDDNFAKAKLATAKFFYVKLLPQVAALKMKIKAGSESTMLLDEALF
ncbi:acyl-CoA dehydrogenase C-terminal domain-containing protein [Agarilytica rhodophyticola]|uniref:acyl-CoA dehydrogenase C-terminal domain-containing protein n=1 Tax=Agarilytica rhodophyticola TaxID=1737490 RepID=UPI000B347FED|nr:acyl-CoA dehydrogenase C-terminal domain-containing protein [Agarilytica rhodophyticola]